MSGTTVQAWIDGGTSTPQATVTVAPSEHTPGLYELTIAHNDGDFTLSGILLDVDSLQHLLNEVTS